MKCVNSSAFSKTYLVLGLHLEKHFLRHRALNEAGAVVGEAGADAVGLFDKRMCAYSNRSEAVSLVRDPHGECSGRPLSTIPQRGQSRKRVISSAPLPHRYL